MIEFNNIPLEILVNGLTIFLLFSSFVNIDKLKMYHILILSSIVTNGYLINKKILRKERCKIGVKQILVASSIGVANFAFLMMFRKLFY